MSCAIGTAPLDISQIDLDENEFIGVHDPHTRIGNVLAGQILTVEVNVTVNVELRLPNRSEVIKSRHTPMRIILTFVWPFGRRVGQ
jgi:hypothetical protein